MFDKWFKEKVDDLENDHVLSKFYMNLQVML